MRKVACVFVCLLSVLLLGCPSPISPSPGDGGGGPTTPPPPAQSTAKSVISFSFSHAANTALVSDCAGAIAESAGTIDAYLPNSAAGVLSTLVPTFTLAPKASASPPSGTARNFSAPVTYTVTAEDGSSRTYTVTVHVASLADSTDSALSSLAVGSTANGTAAVSGFAPGTHSYALPVPAATAVLYVTPTARYGGAGITVAEVRRRRLRAGRPPFRSRSLSARTTSISSSPRSTAAARRRIPSPWNAAPRSSSRSAR